MSTLLLGRMLSMLLGRDGATRPVLGDEDGAVIPSRRAVKIASGTVEGINGLADGIKLVPTAFDVGRYRGLYLRVGPMASTPTGSSVTVQPRIRSLPEVGESEFISWVGATIVEVGSNGYSELLLSETVTPTTNGNHRSHSTRVMRAQVEFQTVGTPTLLSCPWSLWGLP